MDSDGIQLHAFNKLHRIHQETELKETSKLRIKKPDAMEALSAARLGHGERRAVQTRFMDDPHAKATLPISEFVRQGDESFEQFLSPEELKEWKDYEKALEHRATQALRGQLQKWDTTTAPPDLDIPGPREVDPVNDVIKSLTRSKSFNNKLVLTSEPPKTVKSRLTIDVGTSRLHHQSGEKEPPLSAKSASSHSSVRRTVSSRDIKLPSPLGMRAVGMNASRPPSSITSLESPVNGSPPNASSFNRSSASAAAAARAVLQHDGASRIRASASAQNNRASTGSLPADGVFDLLQSNNSDIDLLGSAGSASVSRFGPRYGRRADVHDISSISSLEEMPVSARRSVAGQPLMGIRISVTGAQSPDPGAAGNSVPSSSAALHACPLPSASGAAPGTAKAAVAGIGYAACKARAHFAAALGAGSGNNNKSSQQGKDSLTDFAQARGAAAGSIFGRHSMPNAISSQSNGDGGQGGHALTSSYLKSVVHQAAAQQHVQAAPSRKPQTNQAAQMAYKMGRG